MKIGIFSPYLDSLGGGERYMLTIAECLSGKHQVDIFWDDKLIVEKARQRLLIDLSRTKIVNNFFKCKQFMVKKWLLSRKYDLIIFLSDGSIPFSLAKKNIIHFQCPFPYVKSKTLLNKIKLSRFQAVISNSKFTKKYIDKEYGVNSHIVYPPVEIEKFNPGLKRSLIISVGRFSKYFINKKQKEMAGFFKKISKDLGSWEFYLIGGLLEEDRKYFEELKKLTKNTSIKLFPNISFSNLQKYYNQAKIYWHGAGFGEKEKTNPAGLEHFGISTVEAMSAGCVPITYNGGGQREIIEHGVDGFLWNHEKELIKYTLKLASDENLRVKMAKAAIKKSKNFSKEKFCREINKLLNNLK